MSETTGAMTSNRPYLLRALRDWIVDNGLTPQLLVDAGHAGVDVPKDSIRDGKVVLNVSDRAVSHLEIGNDWICFGARFAGRAHEVALPVDAVLAIYARENGQGMMFATGEEETADGAATDPADADGGDDRPPVRDRSHLKVIK